MGRVKSKYPKGYFKFRNKENAQGERTLYLQYIVDGVPASASSGISLLSSDWDDKKQEVKAKNRSHARLNNSLKQQRDLVDAQIQGYEGRLTPEIVRKMLRGEYQQANKTDGIDFIEYAYEHNKRRYELGKVTFTTYNNDKGNIALFEKFIASTNGEPFLAIHDTNVGIFDKYKQYCINKGNGKETINKKIKPLILAVKYASDNELIAPKTAFAISETYFDLKSRKYVSEVEDKETHYLTPEQLQQFVNLYPTVKYNRTREFMDMFMFSFYACGLRFSDLLTLEWSHIDWKNKELNKNLFKGKVPHNLPLVDSAMEILERWKAKNYNDIFVFDLLDSRFDLNDVELLNKKRLNMNRGLKTSLTELGFKLKPELKFNLSIHVARHSFAVMALNQGVTIHMISKLLGHGSITTTEKVYAKFLPETITEEVKTKLNFCFTPEGN